MTGITVLGWTTSLKILPFLEPQNMTLFENQRDTDRNTEHCVMAKEGTELIQLQAREQTRWLTCSRT